MDKLENRCRLGFENGLHHQFASGIQDRDGDRCFWWRRLLYRTYGNNGSKLHRIAWIGG